jgi:hypothetical protein
VSLPIPDAEAILGNRLGNPVKGHRYVIGFATPSGKVLAIHREASETRVWFQPLAPTKIHGIHVMDRPSASLLDHDKRRQFIAKHRIHQGFTMSPLIHLTFPAPH